METTTQSVELPKIRSIFCGHNGEQHGNYNFGFRVCENEGYFCLTCSLPTVGFGLAVVSGPVDSLGTLVNMCTCAGRASILCMRTDGSE